MIESVLPADFDRQAFLRDYWQKKPLIIRAGELPFADPICPEELAGLACEPDVESRLIQVNAAQDSWTLKNGPFSEAEFENLPESHYSLLVQAVDQWVDEVSGMLSDFDFIPAWRIDDVMVSYATDQGNVGPHFDYYDVFLIQGMGQKRWQIGQVCNSMTPRRDDSGLRLLRDFNVEQEWVVNPGDILYLPPGVSHYGVSLGKSMTYSVGFRAPSHADILSGLLDHVLDGLTEDQRYVDANARLPRHAGEITTDVVDNLRDLVLAAFDQPAQIRQCFGKIMTTPRYENNEDQAPCCDHDHEHPHEHGDGENDGHGGNTDHEQIAIVDVATLREAITSGAEVFKTPGSRFAYAVDGSHAELFADGECYPCDQRMLTFLQALCVPGHTDAVAPATVPICLHDEEAAQLLLSLYNQGSLIIG